MTEAFCGKRCDDCLMKEELNCPGCKPGPGSAMYGDCKIARCARDRGCDGCGSCPKQAGCLEVAVREHVPALRKTKFESDRARRAVMGTRAPFLGRWLWVLFWLSIANMLSVSSFAQEGTALFGAPQWVELLIQSGVALVLLLLSKEEKQYQPAGWCLAALVLHDSLELLATVNGQMPLWAMLTAFVTPAAWIFAEYLLSTAHAAAAADVDAGLPAKWLALRKWNLVTGIVLYAVEFVAVFAPRIIAIVAALGTIVRFVVNILCMVCLYRMARGYRNYKGDAL